jgi:uncharacterized protein with gpF-like domain
MLVNVANDAKFQRYIDRMEQLLHVRMMPVLSAGIRLQMSRGGVPAANYINMRGEPILFRHYRQIYRDSYSSVTDQLESKAARQSQSQFMQEQLSWLEREAAKKIANISQSQVDFIRDRVMAGVRDGHSAEKIARNLAESIPEISRNRAATIARTETHNAAMAAIDESLKYKRIVVKTKTWWSVRDKKVRASHQAVHGTTVPYAEPFNVGGSPMMRPGDDSLGAGADEIINCRCTVLFNT